MQVGESGEDGFDVLVNSNGRLIFLFGPELGVLALNVLANHDERQKQELDNITDKDHKDVREGVERLSGDGLPKHPAEDENNEEIQCIHGADGSGESYGYFVVELEAAFVLEINVNGGAAGFEVFM